MIDMNGIVALLSFGKGMTFLNKYLDRKAFYYYVYDLDGNKIKTTYS